MSNHVNLILSAREPNKLSDILRDLKKFASTNIARALLENPKELGKAGCCGLLKMLVRKITE
jgi:REP element-mobilizing transposase RayT